MIRLFVCATWMVVAAVGCARDSGSSGSGAPAPAAADHGSHGGAVTPPRTTLLGDMGSYHRPITASSPDAQRFFDEGLTLLYGFNHEESYRSFERAAALDPDAAMPHWGMALALGTNYNDTAPPDRLQQAHRHAVHAQERAARSIEVERAFIDALQKRYVAMPDDGQQDAREAAYADAMGEVSRRFPDDLDAATLYAESLMNLRPWKLYTPDGTPETGTDVIVALLEGVLARNGNHPGANHYYIHAVEASRTPERATESAKRLQTLVPGAGHLVHMPAHIWMRTGDYAAAAKSNADAARADERYIEATGAAGMYPAMYYGHNLQFESAAAMMAGNFAQARAAGRKTAEFVDPMAGDLPMLQPFALQEIFALLRFEKWDEVIAQPAPPADRLIQTALYHYTRGAALAGRGQAAEAATELTAFEAAAARIPADAMYVSINTAAVVLDVARQDLSARVADARGDHPAAVAAWRRAVAAEDKVGYNEPPDWLLPSREFLAAALMRAGSVPEAERVYREDLDRNRNNPRSLFGLWKALERQGKTADLAAAKRAFEAAWAAADVTLNDERMSPGRATR
jgi:tetratricopeptide (TPR) repeat protein